MVEERQADDVSWRRGRAVAFGGPGDLRGRVARGRYDSRVTPATLGQGALVWLTGLSGAGKSTIAEAAHAMLRAAGRASYVLDGDRVRTALCRDLGFSPEDRAENVRRLGEVGLLMADAGLLVLVAAIAPYARDRDLVRARAGRVAFVEVHVDTPLAVCESRDPKGLYARARAGTLVGFTGIDAPYETPSRPELVLSTMGTTVAEMAEALVARIELMAR